MNIKTSVNNSELSVVVSGKIDSSNAAEFESGLMSAVAESNSTKLLIDLSALEYVSSAGLRVFLKAKKKCEDMLIIGCSSDVYDIFEVTGFAQILNIRKAMRTVSLKNCEFISRGGCGIVFRIGKDEIIKVFIDRTSEEDIRKTLDRAKAAFLAGIPTPISYDVVKVTDYAEPIALSAELTGKSINRVELPEEGKGTVLGVVYEMMNSDTLAKVVTDNPDKFEEYMQKYTELLKVLHSSEAGDAGVETAKNIYQERLNLLSPYVTNEELENLRKFVDAIPDRDTYVHNDPHIKNVMVSNGELMLIDLDDICKGHPIFDFLALYNDLISTISMEQRQPGFYFQTIGTTTELGQKIWKRVIELYFNTTDPVEIENINNSLQPYVALRTTSVMGGEGMPEQLRNLTLGFMRQTFFPALPMVIGKMYWPEKK